MTDITPKLPSTEDNPETKLDRRSHKKRQRMRVHGKTVFVLKSTIAKKAKRLTKKTT